MSVKSFLDTNVLLYAFSEDARANRAEELLRGGGIISVQVLNEFVNGSRKLNRRWPEIDQGLADIRALLQPPIPLTVKLHERAIALARQHKFAIYDSLIIAAAIEADCDVLYTEDMQHGRKIDALTIQNPFNL